MPASPLQVLQKSLKTHSIELDDDLVDYLGLILACVVEEGASSSSSVVNEALGPFLEASDVDEITIKTICNSLQIDLLPESIIKKAEGKRKLKQGAVSLNKGSSIVDDDTSAYLWGTTNISNKYNQTKEAFKDTSSAKDKRKIRQELEKARRAYEKQANKMVEEEKSNQVAAMVLPDYSTGKNEPDLHIKNVSLGLDSGRLLLDEADIKVVKGRRYGLIGKNGIGKTTLLAAIANHSISDKMPKHHRILHVRQEIRGSEKSVLQTVLEADVERMALVKEERDLLAYLEKDTTDNSNTTTVDKRVKLQEALKESSNDDAEFKRKLTRLDQVYARLQILGSDNAESRASIILSGLQFTEEMQKGPTSALSGGWRMRVSLAAALLIAPDFLMLDEPTNHLDLEAVLWLESYLNSYKNTVVVVSHDRGFLDAICTDIIEFKNLKLNYYKGDYSTYEKTRDEKIRNAMRAYQAFQDKRAHMMEFIEKFRANAKRATLVQSRIKAVEKMDQEAPEMVEIDPVWRFSIPSPEPLGRPIIAVNDITFDYNPEKKSSECLLQDVNFGVDLTSRIGIMGPNGAGKSTLLKLIMGNLNPKSGDVSRNGRLRIGYFTQHSADKFDLQLSSLENMLNMFEHAQDQEMRSFLGKFEIQGADALKPMMMLSGGQKSRVAFASLAFQKPHVIIMDEPTNHLDMESIDALIQATSDFAGGLLVVSHDQFFINKTCKELWVIGDGQATQFRGDFNEYKKQAMERTAKRIAESVKSLSTV